MLHHLRCIRGKHIHARRLLLRNSTGSTTGSAPAVPVSTVATAPVPVPLPVLLAFVVNGDGRSCIYHISASAGLMMTTTAVPLELDHWPEPLRPTALGA